jgi:acyl-coenzyme A synthetase/AMP-(fatty) acid ligase
MPSPTGVAAFHSRIQQLATRADFRSSSLVDTDHECHYREIPDHLRAIQSHLASRGVAAGDCIGVELGNSVRSALLLLALLDAGVGVVLSPARSSSRPESTVPRFCAWSLSIGADTGQAALHDPAAYLLVQRNDAFNPTDMQVPCHAGSIFLRSSGSLSSPKLVAHQLGRLVGNALNVLGRLQLRASHRVTLPVPIFHMYGLGAGFLPALCAGASIDFLDGANVLKYLERERRFDPNVAFLTPTFCDFLLRVRRSPRPYEFVVSAGDTIRASVFERMEELHGPLLNLYGSTEMGSISVASIDLPRELRRVTAGTPYAEVQYRIVEDAFDQEVKSGFGELQLKYEYGFQGYVDADGRFVDSSAVFDDGWFRSGDYATVQPDDALQIIGRRDLSVKRNGRLLPLSDVEHRLRDTAGIRQVAVALGGETIRGRRLVAFCVAEDGATLEAAQIRRSYATNVPAYAVPDDFIIVEAIPTLPNGKVDRRALATLAQQLGGSA